MVRKSDKQIPVDAWCVYIVRCADGTLYTGISNHLSRRVNQHNTDNKLGARYTRTRRPVTLVYTERTENRSTATVRERKIKYMTRSRKLRLISSTSNQSAEKIN